MRGQGELYCWKEAKAESCGVNEVRAAERGRHSREKHVMQRPCGVRKRGSGRQSKKSPSPGCGGKGCKMRR